MFNEVDGFVIYIFSMVPEYCKEAVEIMVPRVLKKN